MKAAVINNFGDVPQYINFPNPIPATGETLIDVKACVLENFDRVTAAGTHYASKKLFPQFPAIVGKGGVGTTPDGTLVAFGSIKQPYGAFAQQVAASYIVPIPDGVDMAEAAAIPQATMTSLLPLKHSAKLQPGETVLINGATGVSGRIAVQVAKLLGAGKVIATGRNEKSLELLTELGADTVVNLQQNDADLAAVFKAAAGAEGIDVVVDFIWGHPAEVLIGTFIPNEVAFAKRRIRYVQIGDKAGASISLPGTALRTSGLELMGIGKIPMDVLQDEITQVWNWIAAKKLYMEIEKVPLANIAEAWQRTDLDGKRIVIMP